MHIYSFFLIRRNHHEPNLPPGSHIMLLFRFLSVEGLLNYFMNPDFRQYQHSY